LVCGEEDFDGFGTIERGIGLERSVGVSADDFLFFNPGDGVGVAVFLLDIGERLRAKTFRFCFAEVAGGDEFEGLFGVGFDSDLGDSVEKIVGGEIFWRDFCEVSECRIDADSGGGEAIFASDFYDFFSSGDEGAVGFE